MVNNQCAGIYGKCLNIKITNIYLKESIITRM